MKRATEQLGVNGSRVEAILHFLRERTSASMAEMSVRFRVSEMTIRRDVLRLVESGQVIRIPGGARLARATAFEKTFAERLQKMGEAKNRIGRAAAALVQKGETVVLDSGTTTLGIARHLRSHRDLVVLTSSLAALEELGSCDSIRVDLTGGTYRRSSHDLVGRAVDEALATARTGKVFFGAAALSFAKGVMVHDPQAPHALIKAGTQRILVIDSSKIGSEALYFFCDIKDCNLVITDRDINPEHLRRLRKLVPVLVAE